MKKFFSMVMVLTILTACNNGKDKEAENKVKYSDLTLEMLNGSITSIEESPYKTDSTGKVGDMDTCCISVSEIDENGNYVKYTEKDSKGNVKSQSVYTRYPDGRWKSSTDTKDGKPSGSMETTSDDKGMYTTAIAYDSLGKVDKRYTGITQNEFAQVLTWKEYDKDSVFRQEGKSEFNKSMQTSFVMMDSVGKVKQKNTSKYNDKGEQTESSNTTITKDSTTTTVKTYTYDTHDDKGNWTQRTTWEKGKATKVVKRTYTYKKEEEKK